MGIRELAERLQKWPWAFRAWVALIITISPVLIVCLIIRDEWDDISSFYKEAWGTLKEGKLP